MFDRLNDALGMVATMRRARLIAPMRPDKYVRIAAAMRRENMGVTSGFAAAARRCPDRPGLVDELGTLTWREIDQRSDAFAAALQDLRYGQPESDVAAGAAPKVIGIMCRNHRGFVEALIAANRIGADVLLLNTSFAGPALAEVAQREGIDAVIYDEEFTSTVDQALADGPGATRIVAWAGNGRHERTIEQMITRHAGGHPQRARETGKLILLTSGTTGTPKGAKHSGGGPDALKAILDRTPWRAEETAVIAAPMFHAWGFSQLAFAASLACTIVTRRKFDPETTLELIDRYRATGLCVVPVMFDRIMELPDAVRDKYSGRSLRFAAASGSRMRPDVVIKFMDQFGDVIYNNYNATEAGMIATATPADLRAAPDTAGKPAVGTEIRILGQDFREVPVGEVGTIFVRNSTQFDGENPHPGQPVPLARAQGADPQTRAEGPAASGGSVRGVCDHPQPAARACRGGAGHRTAPRRGGAHRRHALAAARSAGRAAGRPGDRSRLQAGHRARCAPRPPPVPWATCWGSPAVMRTTCMRPWTGCCSVRRPSKTRWLPGI
jgi:acyl-CoA synthetase (AMP-forming)/AMP-acid ligase II